MNENQLRGPGGVALAREVIEFMRQHEIAPTPSNYELCLTSLGGENPALRAVMDERLGSGQKLNAAFLTDLYERFFTAADASAQIVLAGERLARDLGSVVSFLKSAEEKSGDYGRALETAATDLNSGLNSDQLSKIVSSLAAATLDMANHNQRLNAELQRSSREIEALKSSLESVKIESLTDSLTGVANRRMFDETLRMRVDEAREQQTELCLMLCDVDHFKRFNDTWGHNTGDQILRFLASTLQSHAKPDFLVARYGGEEFAMIMPRTNDRTAAQIAESFRTLIQAKRLRRRSTNEDLGQVTVSIGIAKLQPNEVPTGFVERADACLYASKRGGRNRITTDGAPVLYVA